MVMWREGRGCARQCTPTTLRLGFASHAPDLGMHESRIPIGFALPQQAGLVRIFDRKSCLSVHGEVAYALAKHLYRSTAQVSRSGVADNGLPGELEAV